LTFFVRADPQLPSGFDEEHAHRPEEASPPLAPNAWQHATVGQPLSTDDFQREVTPIPRRE